MALFLSRPRTITIRAAFWQSQFKQNGGPTELFCIQEGSHSGEDAKEGLPEGSPRRVGKEAKAPPRRSFWRESSFLRSVVHNKGCELEGLFRNRNRDEQGAVLAVVTCPSSSVKARSNSSRTALGAGGGSALYASLRYPSAPNIRHRIHGFLFDPSLMLQMRSMRVQSVRESRGKRQTQISYSRCVESRLRRSE